MQFQSVNALLLFDVPKLHDTVDCRSGDLQTGVEPERFDDLVIMSLKRSDAGALLGADVPYFDELIAWNRNQLLFFFAEIQIPNTWNMTLKRLEQFKLLGSPNFDGFILARRGNNFPIGRKLDHIYRFLVRHDRHLGLINDFQLSFIINLMHQLLHVPHFDGIIFARTHKLIPLLGRKVHATDVHGVTFEHSNTSNSVKEGYIRVVVPQPTFVIFRSCDDEVFEFINCDYDICMPR